ncbi:MAG: hypothetical protein KAT65_27135 [Methanophagales archaeon]|nr:hypothetical protein [Methanophagales archaeon]
MRINALDDLNMRVDGVIITVAHDAFMEITLDVFKGMMNDESALIDVRRMFNEEETKERGLYYKKL